MQGLGLVLANSTAMLAVGVLAIGGGYMAGSKLLCQLQGMFDRALDTLEAMALGSLDRAARLVRSMLHQVAQMLDTLGLGNAAGTVRQLADGFEKVTQPGGQLSTLVGMAARVLGYALVAILVVKGIERSPALYRLTRG